ncbi:MAG: MFS transporter [Burkholderiales bacterium]|nr:MAG: MFS transporter [Burkholderiales bacterium]
MTAEHRSAVGPAAAVPRHGPGAVPVATQAAIIAAGVVAALHIGKLPPALPALREQLGLSLLQAGWLVSVFQIAGAVFALGSGALADRFGHRRMVMLGLALLALGDALGALSPGAGVLLVSRAIESAGMLLAAVSCPALLTRLTPPERLRVVMGFWGSYVPLGMAIGLVGTPALMLFAGWQLAWWACALLSLLTWAVLARLLPAQRQALASAAAAPRRTATLLVQTLRSPRPWLLAACFMFYSSQWIGVFSFLPTLYAQAGLGLGLASALTAAGVLINVAGNIGGGLLHGGGMPRWAMIATGACAMMLGAFVAFGTELPFAVRYLAILLFSGIGGMIPSTLFSSAAAYAPGPQTVSSTVGLMQQGSSLGQVISPVALAALAQSTGSWQYSWLATGSFGLLCLSCALLMARLDRGTARERAD